MLFKDLGNDRDSRIDRIRDDQNERLGRVLGDAGREVTNNACVDLEGRGRGSEREHHAQSIWITP